ncbi:MAG: DUF5050 domain-containing protein [Coriobacteriales bacterium]|nr:DUF5050 domain-containing protein [Coriobacteriales bacterium]
MKYQRVFSILLSLFSAFSLGSCAETGSTEIENRNNDILTLIESVSGILYEVDASFWADRVTDTRSLTETDDSVFYISTEGLERYNKSSDSSIVLVESPSIKLFYIDDGFIYYCEGGNTIYRVDMEGSNQVTILEREVTSDSDHAYSFSQVLVYRDYLYYSLGNDSMCYYRYSLHTHETDVLANDAAMYVFYENSFYYIEHAGKSFSIYKKDLVNDDTKLIRGDGIYYRDKTDNNAPIIDNIFLVDNQIIYTTRSPAAVYKLEDDKNDVLVSSFVELDNRDYDYVFAYSSLHKLYYSYTWSSEFILYEYDVRTSETREYLVSLNADSRFGLKVINGYAFIHSKDDYNQIEYIYLVDCMT